MRFSADEVTNAVIVTTFPRSWTEIENTIKQLGDIGKQYSNDVIVSPRPDNSMAIAAASWGRLLKLDAFNGDTLKKFIETNRNRSPEPGVR